MKRPMDLVSFNPDGFYLYNTIQDNIFYPYPTHHFSPK